MKNRSLSRKILAAGFSGALCLSTTAFAATPDAGQTSMDAARPAGQDSQGVSASKSAASPDVTQPAANPGTYSDAEILGLVQTIDNNEIDAAAKAEKKKISSEAMAYAKMLRDQHKADLKETKKLAKQTGLKPAETLASDQLKSKGKEGLKTLSDKNGSDFEKAYIDAMVNGHTEALQLIDAQLIPSAQNSQVKTFLTGLRDHVAMHLEQGKRLQGSQAAAATD